MIRFWLISGLCVALGLGSSTPSGFRLSTMTATGDVTAARPSLAGQHVLVAGLGITGQSVISLLASHGAQVTAADSRDDAERTELAERLAKDGVDRPPRARPRSAPARRSRPAPGWSSPRRGCGRTRRCWPAPWRPASR